MPTRDTDVHLGHNAGQLMANLGRTAGDKNPLEQIKTIHKLKSRRYFQPKSLCVFTRQNWLRRWCIRIATNVWFDRIVVAIIVLNCLVLAIMDPLDVDRTSLRSRINDESEIYFTVAFTIEMAIKIVALGFVGKGSYLADRWNWLDFIVVCVAYVSMVPGVDSVSALRTFRVLRPLRTLSTIPEMAVIVNSMLASIPALFNVFLLCVFIFFIFGIVGLQLWNGVLRGRCAYNHPTSGMRVVEESTFCALPCAKGDTCSATFGDECGMMDVPVFNGTAWNVIATQMSCVDFDNPRFGLISFDNIGVACLTIFTSITLEGWVDVMYALNATWGIDVFTAIYFVLLIMFGSFFLLNLALAVIWDEYVKANEALEAEEAAALELKTAREEAEAEAKAEAEASVRALAAADESAGGVMHNPDAAAGAAVVPVEDAELASKELDETTGKVPPGFWGGCCYRDRHHGYLYYFVESMAFSTFIISLILLNTATLACEHYDMNETFSQVLSIMNYVFTALFFVEMVLKLFGLGVCGYLASNWNRFDGFIVMVSLLEIYMELADVGGSGGGLSTLRTFRLMRVLRLARSWKDLRNLLITIVKSIKDVANASVVLLIVMFIFCLLGMQLFGGQMGEDKFEGEQPRAHFDTLWWSFVTVFQVLTGENWNEVLYDTVHATGSIAIFFFLLLNVVGNYLILNLFLAILLGNFDSDDDEEEEEEAEGGDAKAKALKDKAATTPGSALADGPVVGSASVHPMPTGLGADPGTSAEAAAKYRVDADTPATDSKAAVGGVPAGAAASADGATEVLVDTYHTGADAGAGGARAATAWGGDSVAGTGAAGAAKTPANAPPPAAAADAKGKKKGQKKRLKLSKNSLLVLSRTNPLRLFCARVVTHRFFDPFIILLIGISTVLLAMDEPRVATCKLLPASDPENCINFANFLAQADLVITIIFVLEMVLKIVYLGFVFGKTSYLRNGWNVLDFVIVVISLLSLGLGDATQLKALRSLRALRALRPLRVVSRYPGLRLVVNSIFGSMPKVSNVMLVNLLFMLIFAIVGVQSWMGALNSCNDPTIATKDACVGDFMASGSLCDFLPFEKDQVSCRLGNGTMFPRRWEPPPFHFDNTGNALLTVFEVASGEMWPNIMYNSVDAVGLDEPMARDASPAAALYFILINIVCAFFMLEIFTGVVIDNFNKMKEASEGAALLTHQQQMWVETMKMMIGTQPKRRMRRPQGFAKGCRTVFFRVATWKYFEHFIMTAIVVNTLVMALRHYDQGPDWDLALDVLNWVFAGLFTVEAIIKLLAFGVQQYFSVGWNRFDFILVVLSYVGELVDLGQLATLLRIVRVARIFRLIRTSRGLQTMFKTLLISFPQLLNVGAVLLLVYFIYAIVGMNLFSDIKHGMFLNSDANFGSFFMTMITLFRMSTGESYNGLMHDCMIQEPYCDPDHNCGFQVFAPLYFISFYVMSAFILLNLLIAIILDNFMDTVALDEGRKGFVLSDSDMAHFQEVWSRFDATASGFMPASKMVNVLLELEYPLGLKNTPGVNMETTLRKQARTELLDMNIPEHEGRVVFLEVLRALAARAVGPIQVPGGVPILNDLERQHNRIMKSVAKGPKQHSVHEHMAAGLMQSAFHGANSAAVAGAGTGALRSIGDAAGSAPPARATLAVAGAEAEATAAGEAAAAEAGTKVVEVEADDGVGHANAGMLPRPPSSKRARRSNSGTGEERSSPLGAGMLGGPEPAGSPGEVVPIGVPSEAAEV